MSWKKRPGINELQGKLLQAKTALTEDRCHFGINVEKLVDDFIELNIDNAEEIWPLLKELLEEITPEYYAGPHPPMKSADTNLNCELFIFVWNSKKMKKNMYLKFAIKDNYFYYISLHKSKKPDKCWKFVNNFQRSNRK